MSDLYWSMKFFIVFLNMILETKKYVLETKKYEEYGCMRGILEWGLKSQKTCASISRVCLTKLDSDGTSYEIHNQQRKLHLVK
jgi:hypothetical protein